MDLAMSDALMKPIRFLRLYIVILILLALPFSSSSQGYKKDNKRFYRSYYKKQNSWYSNACNLLENKRHRQSNIRVSGKANKPRHAAETETSYARATVSTEPKPQTKVQPKPEPEAKPLPITPKIEHVSAEKIEELHKREDEVLAENKLPVPTSKQQEQVRKIVADKLASKTNVYPLSLAPLYFNFAQDEFSVVDMEPFLIAAEYAIQGRTVLIEGHTDSRGQDDYNVKLSIKRVQKIRQLMIDMGVPDDRISVVGYGEEMKSNTNKTTQGRELNRRVDFTIF
jgi:outer membrane protein OmpA-like peptidoglycan-associated protein